VANTPRRGRARSPRGWTRSLPRSARSSQNKTRILSPGSTPASPSLNSGHTRIRAGRLASSSHRADPSSSLSTSPTGHSSIRFIALRLTQTGERVKGNGKKANTFTSGVSSPSAMLPSQRPFAHPKLTPEMWTWKRKKSRRRDALPPDPVLQELRLRLGLPPSPRRHPSCSLRGRARSSQAQAGGTGS